MTDRNETKEDDQQRERERERERAETVANNKLWSQPPEKVFKGRIKMWPRGATDRRRGDQVSLNLLLLAPP